MALVIHFASYILLLLLISKIGKSSLLYSLKKFALSLIRQWKEKEQ